MLSGMTQSTNRTRKADAAGLSSGLVLGRAAQRLLAAARWGWTAGTIALPAT